MRSTTTPPLNNRAVGASRIRAEGEDAKPDPKTGEAMKTIELADPETGIAVTVKIPAEIPKEDEEAVARAVRAERRRLATGHREREFALKQAAVLDAQRRIRAQVGGRAA